MRELFGPLRTIEVDPSEPFAANALRVGDAVVYPAEHRRNARTARGGGRLNRFSPLSRRASSRRPRAG